MPFKSLLTTTGFIMILITVCRTLFYQFFLLFVGLSVGFLLNAEYVGWKYPVVQNSIYNIFYPIDFEDEGVLNFLYGRGRLKVFGVMGKYKDVEIIEEAMAAFNKNPMTDEEAAKYINEGTLNSRETDRAFRLRDELKGIKGNSIKF